MDTKRITYLLQQYLDDRLTREEQEELDHALQQDSHTEQMRLALGTLIQQEQDRPVSEEQAHPVSEEKAHPSYEEQARPVYEEQAHPVSEEQVRPVYEEQARPAYVEKDWDPLFEKIRSRTLTPVRRIPKLRLSAAAAVILLAIATWLVINTRNSPQPLAAAATPANQPPADINPGGNKATLTLADNTTIDLDDAKDGVLGQQGNTKLIKQRDGQLSYQPAGARPSTPALAYNLLTTPRGGQYQLTLPDGSKVWLNAASRLKYPTSFSGNERVVELSGEAYFEIAPNPAMPFRVSLMGEKDTHIEVLGTSFNIKAYNDEPVIRTTLMTGSVKVRKNAAAILLRPGQQAGWNDRTDIKVTNADLEETIAWKDGLFRFNEATIEEVMRQLSRWYDVEVVYVNGIPDDLFRGEIYRNVSVSKVLKVLEASGVRFTVEGKKIFVRS